MSGPDWALPLSVFTIYERPRDFPLSFVVREYVVGAAGEIVASEIVAVAETLSAARALLAKQRPDLARIPRLADDDPVIVESWV
jgi:hypothetical protein